MIVSSLLLTSCAWLNDREKVSVLKAFDLRHEVEPGSNIHSIKLTLEIDRDDLKKIGSRSLMVQSVNCENSDLKAMYRRPYGFNVNPVSDGDKSNLVDFSLLETSVPTQIESVMAKIEDNGCAFVFVQRGYGLTEYYSDPFEVEFESIEALSPRT